MNGRGLDYDHIVRDFGVDYRFVQRNEDIGEPGIYLTNYETIREHKLNIDRFDGFGFDEASILRGFGGTKTFRALMGMFEGSDVYRFVDTATPSPNDFIELLSYSAFLGIMDVGQAKTRFFRRNSEKADELTLHPHKEREFWLWVSSWAVYLQKPSDLGYSDEGYELPELDIRWHEIPCVTRDAGAEPSGQGRLIANAALGVVEASREKRESLDGRIAKMLELRALDPGAHRLIWHDLEAERAAIEDAAPSAVTVWGSQDLEEREASIRAFSDGKIQELATKPVIAGSGCNFQRHCAWEIFLGIGFKFHDFIQAIHRCYRFLQTNRVRIDLIYTEAEREVRRELERKWAQHNELTAQMSAIIREYGLATNALRSELDRSFGVEREETRGERFLAAHNDCIPETQAMEADGVHLVLTSIPFSNQYEYSPSYNDFGHTDSNEHFWEQMDYLIPELYRVLQPGRVAAIHVKDRITPSGLGGLGFQTVYPFHMDCHRAFVKHGFGYLGMKTIVTGYADVPVVKEKCDYTRSRWQIDAHGFARSSGNRLLSAEDLAGVKHDVMFKLFRQFSLSEVYDHEHHVALSESLEKCRRCGHLHTGDKRCAECDCQIDAGLLPKKFMLLQPQSWHPDVWTDIARMRTMNMLQAAAGREMHLCPLQFDIVDRVITQFSKPDEIVYDPFMGIGTVPMRAVKLGRRGLGVELSVSYYADAVRYLYAEERKAEVPTLFDLMVAMADEKPLCIDLFCGLGGWSEGFLANGYRCIGYDIEAHDYGTGGYPGELILRDVRSIHGSEFRNAAVIVCSPPCQRYSYMAMPWKRAKAMAAEIEADATGTLRAELNELFNECFRIQREAIEAAGHHIPLVVENVRGAEKWVGPARWHFGSFYLWGDVPALMPLRRGETKLPPAINESIRQGKSPARWTNPAEHYFGIKNGRDWFGSGENCSLQRRAGSKSTSRKAASAQIAKIPFPLADWIAKCFLPAGIFTAS